MQKTSIHIFGGYFGVLCAAGVLYVASCAPGALWQDSGLIQYRTWHNDIEGPLGLALSHPLYYLLAIGAKLTGLGEFGYRVNLVSALAGAVAVANLYLLVHLWLGEAFPALLAAATLALSHTFWQHASIAETYTLWVALFLGELIVLLQYTRTKRLAYLYALGLLNGLALAVHILATIPLLCYVVWLVVLSAKRTIRARNIAVLALLWMIGALPYGYLIVKHIVGTGDVLGTLASAAFGARWQADVLNTGLSWTLVKENVLLLLYNVPTPNILLFFAGLIAFRRVACDSVFRIIFAVLMVLFFVFAFRYTVADRYAFFIPFYSLAAATVGLGAQLVRTRLRGRLMPAVTAVFALMPVAVYAVVPGWAERAQLSIGTRADVAYRNDYAYFLRPWKTGEDGPERFAQAALTVAEPDAVIYADTTTAAPLLYVQEVDKVRPDVQIVTGTIRSEGAPPYDEDTFESLVRRRHVYVTSDKPGYGPPFVLGKHRLMKTGPLWRVTGSCGAAH
ncbi:MAG: DUF2723 domain-containing protein [Sedimentisphaerales bacterium]|nr:DUF2723 domain-containing protein [Sedimentisphaerales bacterium]